MQEKLLVKIIDSNKREVEIRNEHWPLAENLFENWGMYPSPDNVIKVCDVNDITPELSAWGIPWKRTGV